MRQHVLALLVSLGGAAAVATAAETTQEIGIPDIAIRPLMVERVQELDALLERIRTADDPKERGRLIQEYRNKMYENVAMMGQLMERRMAGLPASSQTSGTETGAVPGPYGLRGAHPGYGRGNYPPMARGLPGMSGGGYPPMGGPGAQIRHGPSEGAAEMDAHHTRMEGYLAKIAELMERLVELQEKPTTKQ